MKKIYKFIKTEIVFSIACILAVISMFFVVPSKEYVDYIDFRTLSLLLALMLVVQGLKSCRLFDALVSSMMKHISNRRQLAMMLVLLCFFSSMLITNDVALITFVPFTIMLLSIIGEPSFSIYLIVLETIAANLGSMFTPIGNPQNLYLYSVSGLNIGEFLMLMIPYTVISLVLLIIAIMVIKPALINTEASVENKSYDPEAPSKENANHTTSASLKLKFFPLTAYIILFVICILTVLHILDYRIMLGIVLVSILLINRRLIAEADYILLLTFIAFFIFIGNMKHIPAVNDMLSSLVTGCECIVAVAASQIVSNVPAAMLLSGFTNKYSELIIGTNLGGLGTLIASMASLISFKFYGKTKDSNTGKYIAVFTGMNIAFLVVLIAAYYIL